MQTLERARYGSRAGKDGREHDRGELDPTAVYHSSAGQCIHYAHYPNYLLTGPRTRRPRTIIYITSMDDSEQLSETSFAGAGTRRARTGDD